MKKAIFSISLFGLAIFSLMGCTLDISAPSTIEVSSSSPITATPGTNSTNGPSNLTSKIQITWASLSLTGKLAYISSNTLNGTITTNIQVLDLSTGEVTTIFRAPVDAWVFYITISPDAKQLVMSYIPPSQPGSASTRILYIMPMDGTIPPQPLFTPPSLDDRYTQAEWSPDGKYIYYAHYNANDPPLSGPTPDYDILRMKYPNGQPEKIVDHAFWPRLSSDSTRLVYISLDPISGKNTLSFANADGSNPQQVTFSGSGIPEIIDAPIFSPDGQSILFSAPPPSQVYQPNWFDKLMGVQIAQAHSIPSDWWSVPITGGVPTRLTQLQTINLFASISADGKHLASLSGDGIFVMDLNGSDLTRLVADPNVLGTVNWIP